MDFSLRSAYAHGTRPLRTHLDSVAPQEEISWPVFETMREQWRGRIDLQACLPARHRRRSRPEMVRGWQRVAAAKGRCSASSPTWCRICLKSFSTRCLRKRRRHGLDLDFHADETDDVAARSLKKIAEAACGTVSRETSSSAIAARWRASRTSMCWTRWTRWPRRGWRWCRCRCAISICRIGALTEPRRAGAA